MTPTRTAALWALAALCCAVVSGDEALFWNWARPDRKPGRFPVSRCDALATLAECETTHGCGWLAGVHGVCREDPVARCISSGECSCAASDFHGDAGADGDLEVFLPISITWDNRAATHGQYSVHQQLEAIPKDEWGNPPFTSRTDFTHRTLSVEASRCSLRLPPAYRPR